MLPVGQNDNSETAAKSEFFDRLIALVKKSDDLKPRTKRVYIKNIIEFSEFTHGFAQDNELGVEAWRDELLKRGLSAQTINVCIYAIKYASSHGAARLRMPDFAAQAKILPVTQRRNPPPPLSMEDARAIVMSCAGNGPFELRDRAICVLGFRTGIKPYAICHLNMSDLQADQLYVDLGRGSKTVLTLDPETVATLNEWRSWLLTQRSEGYLFCGLLRKRAGQTVKILASNVRLSQELLYDVIERRAKKAGLKKFRPDQFHTTYEALSAEDPE